MKQNEKIKCPTCGKVFVNNPSKHFYRQKYTPCCRTPYTMPHTFLPNLNWIRERISRLRWRQDSWKFKARGRIEKQMMLERQRKGNFDDIPSEEINHRVEEEYKAYKKSKEFKR